MRIKMRWAVLSPRLFATRTGHSGPRPMFGFRTMAALGIASIQT